MDKDTPNSTSSPPETINSSSSPSKVYAFWKDFDLEKEKTVLGEKRKKLADGRKNCIEKQKKWGVESADEKATFVETSEKAPLLLDYEAEVNRADEAEKAFIELSSKIARALDPIPILSVVCRDDNKRINWDFDEVLEEKGFKVRIDESKDTESRFLRDYIVGNSKGNGGFGKVFLCLKRIDKNLYAVKRISIKADEKQEKYLSEVYALSRLQHRNIVRYYDAWIEPYSDLPVVENLVEETRCGEDSHSDLPVVENSVEETSYSEASTESTTTRYSDTLHIQMQYCAGSNLCEIILGKQITKDKAWQYMRQITEGLDYIHQNKIVHADLTSQNVVIDEWADAIIVDFGLAAIPTLPRVGSEVRQEGCETDETDETDKDVVQPGNKLYFAPERLGENPSQLPSSKWDIYSLGILFVELAAGLTSKVPEIERLSRIRDAKAGKFPDIPLPDQQWIKEMLAHDPESRPSTRKVLGWLNTRRRDEPSL